MNFKNFKDIKCIVHTILLPSTWNLSFEELGLSNDFTKNKIVYVSSIKIDDKIDSICIFTKKSNFRAQVVKSFFSRICLPKAFWSKVPILHFTRNALLTFTASTKQNLSPITQLLITSFERGYAQLNHLSLYYLNALTIDILTSADDGI